LCSLQNETFAVGTLGKAIQKAADGILLEEPIKRLSTLLGEIEKAGADGGGGILHIIASR
jgi:hypothetical protein